MATASRALKLHHFAKSGHCHRVELIDVDLRAGVHKQPAFLQLNPFGEVPVLEDGDLVLADSNAILVYLAEKYGGPRWRPASPVAAAAIQRWLSVAAGPVAFGPAAARASVLFGVPHDVTVARSRAHSLFAVLESELAKRPFLTGETVTIADLANYTYIAHAPEGGVSLARYPRIRAWLASIEALEGFVPMPASPVTEAA